MNNPLTPERSHTLTPKACRNDDLIRKTHHFPNPDIKELLEIEADEDETVMALLRCDSSPIYASRPSSTLGKRGSDLYASFSPVLDPNGFWVNVEKNLRIMDRQNEADFTNWIRNERNLTLSLPHLKRTMFDYDFDRIINGLKWLIFEWRLASIATTIKYLLIDDIWLSIPLHENIHTTTNYSQHLCVAGACYSITKPEFRNRIGIVMALIDGWNFEHVRELFHFLCIASCTSTIQSAFLLQALLLAFPEQSIHARQLKRKLIESFLCH